MTAKMTRRPAVSTPSPDPQPPYCLLKLTPWQEYRCVETAVAMSALGKGDREIAYWKHYKSHAPAYARWAEGKGLTDPRVTYDFRSESATELVREALLSFHDVVCDGRYDAEQGLPCKYLKQCIRNRRVDLLRKGRRPSSGECRSCWEEHEGSCPSFGAARPWERAYRSCHRTSHVSEFDFDKEEALFAAAGLQEAWPPQLGPSQSVVPSSRPVETLALDHVIADCVWSVAEEVLTPDQRDVLMLTFVEGKKGPEIAFALHKKVDNVYKIRQRALRRLYRALTRELPAR